MTPQFPFFTTTTKQVSQKGKVLLLPQNYVPSDSDIVCGRGKLYSMHPGNRKYARAIRGYLQCYLQAPTRIDRSIVVASVVMELQESGHRFVKLDNSKSSRTATGQSWFVLNDDATHEKVSHAIRDVLKKNPVELQQQGKHAAGLGKKKDTDKSRSTTTSNKNNAKKVANKKNINKKEDGAACAFSPSPAALSTKPPPSSNSWCRRRTAAPIETTAARPESITSAALNVSGEFHEDLLTNLSPPSGPPLDVFLSMMMGDDPGRGPSSSSMLFSLSDRLMMAPPLLSSCFSGDENAGVDESESESESSVKIEQETEDSNDQQQTNLAPLPLAATLASANIFESYGDADIVLDILG